MDIYVGIVFARLNESLFNNNNNTGIYNIVWGNNTLHNGNDNTIYYNSMIGESLLLLKGHSRSHMTCKALCPFQLKCVVVIVKVTRLNTKQ